jgi:hypothetical protein
MESEPDPERIERAMHLFDPFRVSRNLVAYTGGFAQSRLPPAIDSHPYRIRKSLLKKTFFKKQETEN